MCSLVLKKSKPMQEPKQLQTLYHNHHHQKNHRKAHDHPGKQGSKPETVAPSIWLLHRMLFITFLNTSQAFDIIDHRGMLNALYSQGVRDRLWLLFNDLYSDLQSVVKLDGELLMIAELQGILQGRSSSTATYKAEQNSPKSNGQEPNPHD